MSENTAQDSFVVPYNDALLGVTLGLHALGAPVDILHTCRGPASQESPGDKLLGHDLSDDSGADLSWILASADDWHFEKAPILLNRLSESCKQRKSSLAVITYEPGMKDMAWSEEAARKMRGQLPCPLLKLPQSLFAGDFFTGYAGVVNAMLGLVPWDKPSAERHNLVMAGLLFHRHEGDQQANVQECRRLVEALGIMLGPPFLAAGLGDRFAEGHRADVILCLPYAGVRAEKLAKHTNRMVIESPLPMGITATKRMLQLLATELAIPSKRLDFLFDREEKNAMPGLNMAKRVLEGKRIAIVADTAMAAAWCGLALELGLEPSHIVLLDRSMGGPQTLAELIAKAGHEPPRNARVVWSPDEEGLRHLVDENPPDVVVRPGLDLSGSAWEHLPTVETGFPSRHKHFVSPTPILGFSGAVAQAQRIVDAVMKVH